MIHASKPIVHNSKDENCENENKNERDIDIDIDIDIDNDFSDASDASSFNSRNDVNILDAPDDDSDDYDKCYYHKKEMDDISIDEQRQKQQSNQNIQMKPSHTNLSLDEQTNISKEDKNTNQSNVQQVPDLRKSQIIELDLVSIIVGIAIGLFFTNRVSEKLLAHLLMPIITTCVLFIIIILIVRNTTRMSPSFLFQQEHESPTMPREKQKNNNNENNDNHIDEKKNEIKNYRYRICHAMGSIQASTQIQSSQINHIYIQSTSTMDITTFKYATEMIETMVNFIHTVDISLSTLRTATCLRLSLGSAATISQCVGRVEDATIGRQIRLNTNQVSQSYHESFHNTQQFLRFKKQQLIGQQIGLHQLRMALYQIMRKQALSWNFVIQQILSSFHSPQCNKDPTDDDDDNDNDNDDNDNEELWWPSLPTLMTLSLLSKFRTRLIHLLCKITFCLLDSLPWIPMNETKQSISNAIDWNTNLSSIFQNISNQLIEATEYLYGAFPFPINEKDKLEESFCSFDTQNVSLQHNFDSFASDQNDNRYQHINQRDKLSNRTKISPFLHNVANIRSFLESATVSLWAMEYDFIQSCHNENPDDKKNNENRNDQLDNDARIKNEKTMRNIDKDSNAKKEIRVPIYDNNKDVDQNTIQHKQYYHIQQAQEWWIHLENSLNSLNSLKNKFKFQFVPSPSSNAEQKINETPLNHSMEDNNNTTKTLKEDIEFEDVGNTSLTQLNDIHKENDKYIQNKHKTIIFSGQGSLPSNPPKTEKKGKQGNNDAISSFHDFHYMESFIDENNLIQELSTRLKTMDLMEEYDMPFVNQRNIKKNTNHEKKVEKPSVSSSFWLGASGSLLNELKDVIPNNFEIDDEDKLYEKDIIS